MVEDEVLAHGVGDAEQQQNENNCTKKSARELVLEKRSKRELPMRKELPLVEQRGRDKNKSKMIREDADAVALWAKDWLQFRVVPSLLVQS